ncbi:hypothetical protein GCM10023091_29130 [Ravibacter arvi]|uniref:GH16 domain-containing protein n=1 Tax=Ravibacter arvi TaxID=2051041 RepID=A0ABP8M146_9BACT
MKKYLATALSLLGILLINGCAPKADNAQKSDWELVWADDFDYEGLPDDHRWSYDVGDHGWGNRELQNYLGKDTSTAYVHDGNLRIKANRVITGNDTTYTSARLVTKGKGDWKYGKIEVRAKTSTGKGILAAIWMLPTDHKHGGWPQFGEIDIMEHLSLENYRDSIFQTTHTGAYNHLKGTQRGARTYIKNPWEDFHIYSVEWSPEGIYYLIDGVKRYHFPNESKSVDEWPFDVPFHLLMNISVGGNWEGSEGIDPATFPAEMLVDYVRVYQEK